MKISAKTPLLLLMSLIAGCTAGISPDAAVDRSARWTVELRLAMPDLVPQAVMWTVVEEDPLPGFEKRVREKREVIRKLLESAPSPEIRELRRKTAIATMWNRGLSVVRGDQVHLLTTRTGFSSDTPAGRKWIITTCRGLRANMFDEQVAWCIPVDVEHGSRHTVTFAAENVLDLDSVYTKAMQPLLRKGENEESEPPDAPGK